MYHNSCCIAALYYLKFLNFPPQESELKLPDPVDYEKPWGDTTEEEPSSLINFED